MRTSLILGLVLVLLLQSVALAQRGRASDTNQSLANTADTVEKNVSQNASAVRELTPQQGIERLDNELKAGLAAHNLALLSTGLRIDEIERILSTAPNVNAAIESLKIEFKAEVDKSLEAIAKSRAEVDAAIDDVVKSIRPTVLAELAKRAERDIKELQLQIQEMERRFAEEKVDAMARHVLIQEMVKKLVPIEARGTDGARVVNPEAFKVRTKLAHRGARGMRSNPIPGGGTLYWYPDGAETPLGQRVVTVYTSIEPNGPKTKVGDFATDANGRFDYDVRAPGDRKAAPKLFIHYEFLGDDVAKPAEYGPKQVGIMS